MMNGWRIPTTLAMLRSCTQRSLLSVPFSTTSRVNANRAVVFSEAGRPASVLRTHTFPTLSSPPAGSVNIRYRLAPVNPSDINVIEGSYPLRPVPDVSVSSDGKLFVPGNEGLGEVTAVGDDVQGLSVGDWVVVAKQQSGTWVSARSARAEDVIKLPKGDVSEVNAATIIVNPPTAYNMLREFVDLKEGDWVVQNGANSAVGQVVIQIAARRGIKTINFVRNRENFEELERQLKALGATHVLRYDDLADKEKIKTVQSWTKDAPIRLFLNCVGGNSVTKTLRLVGHDAHLVTYGAMAREPLTLPASPLIFKGLVARGFWQSHWYDMHGRKEREELMRALVDLKLKGPEHEIVTVPGNVNDEEASQLICETMRRMSEGKSGRKVMLRIEERLD
ncbi:hypothetical protein CERSUDRAFT_81807 [Gelatoporia subvermispora B]|uniref:enoyl-[acyl-carrier-protein] reductase n=1 Tax=Ceriporiopsis subvermispora (strain B) TaxID=914234 RepID=M2RKQ0_CERS8|nr:hypothetical protein CERSUDRAFT_81807 [Gelatoporia subvermispora B]